MSKADEIRVQYRDRRSIPDIAEHYPEATINLTRYYPDCDIEIDWQEINNYKILCKDNFVFGLSLEDEMLLARSKNIDFYYLGALRTFQELNDMKRLGACRVRLGAPLFFQMDKVKKFEIPIYAVANVANGDTVFSREDGVTGTWIRPEDIALYEDYIDVIEFNHHKTGEQALYRIYAEQKAWSSGINLIIKDINYEATNRMISPDLAKTRLNCGQRCQENGQCHLCYRTLDLANPDKIK